MSASSQTMDISADSWNMVYALLSAVSGWLSSKGVKLASSLMEVILMKTWAKVLAGAAGLSGAAALGYLMHDVFKQENELDKQMKETEAEIQQKLDEMVESVRKHQRKERMAIINNVLKDMTLDDSVKLAQECGVPENDILHNEDDVDELFTK